MKLRINKHFYLFIILILGLSSCESEYSKLVKRELASDIKNDSLLLGLKFNQTKQDFFDICQDLNNQKLINQGPENRFAEYTFKGNNSKESSIQMLFYGIFDKQNIMTGLDIRFSYNAWSPWNKMLYADKLIPRINDTLQKWFPGNDFIKVNLKNLNSDVFVKVDGNRQIKMYTLNDKSLVVKIEDLDNKRAYNEHSK
jgi:hypothetical protein